MSLATQLAPATKVALPASLEKVRRHFDGARPARFLGLWYRRMVARRLAYLIPPDARVLEVGCGAGELLALLPHADVTGIDVSEKQIERARRNVPRGIFHCQAGEQLTLTGTFTHIIISDTLNFSADVQALLERLQTVSTRSTRLIVNFHNHLWRPFFALAETLRVRDRAPVSNWISSRDVKSLGHLADWEFVTMAPSILVPFPLLGLDRLVNRYLPSFLPALCLTHFCTFTSSRHTAGKRPSVSIVVPARNEAGNIAAAVARLPRLAPEQELIFIEGNSTDNTWPEIQRVAQEHPEANIVTLQQSGRGKGNAVREAFAVARGDVLMILDADLTVAPEELSKFYDALVLGKCEFANGSRLVYPMDNEAMQFANMVANHFFGRLFTWLLGQPIKDTLCGTKVLFRSDYQRIAANRAYFGDFDPFGDFDLLFGAGKMGLKIMDVPVRYHARTYGTTNIQRWRHGWMLLRMAAFAAARMKFLP